MAITAAVALEQKLANKYLRKIDNARSRKIDFSLTFAEYKRIMLRKRCAYTGVILTMHKGGQPSGNDVTLERIDNEQGYHFHNCIAVSYTANSIKSVFENPNTPIGVAEGIKMFAAIDRLQKQVKKNTKKA
jgi:hypothetical protein